MLRKKRGAGLRNRLEIDPARKEDAGLSARILPSRRFGWGDSNRRDLQQRHLHAKRIPAYVEKMRKIKDLSVTYIIQ
jgi:hypothetical protein